MKSKYFSINTSGNSVRCKIYYQDLRNVERIVLCLHGFAGHKDGMAVQHFAEKALSKYKTAAVICYDHPCHGDDALNRLTLEACDRYLGFVLQYVGEQFPGAELYNYSTSFGGYLVLKYLSDHGKNPFRRICFRCPAVVMYRVLTETILTQDELKTLAEGGEVPSGFDRKVMLSPAFMQSLKDNDITELDFTPYAGSMRIAQGTADELVPYEAVKSFAEKNGIEMITVKDADHRFLDPGKMREAITLIAEFLGE